MRGLVLVLLVGCIVRNDRWSDDSTPPPVYGDPSATGCRDGRGCLSSQVCARNGQCLAPDQVHAVHVSWTLQGLPASTTTCAAAPDLLIDLSNSRTGENLAYAPVPCVEGLFSVDRLPISFDKVGLGRESRQGWQETTINAMTGEAALDLPY